MLNKTYLLNLGPLYKIHNHPRPLKCHRRRWKIDPVVSYPLSQNPSYAPLIIFKPQISRVFSCPVLTRIWECSVLRVIQPGPKMLCAMYIKHF